MFYANLPKVIPEDAVLRRLGYRANATQLDKETRQWLHACIMDAAPFVHPSGIYELAQVLECTSDILILKCPNDNIWEIRDVPGVCKMFTHARYAWIAATTIGNALSEEISRQIHSLNTAVATVYDATGSECADAAMDSMQNMAIQSLHPQGLSLDSHRFSPGYGNWSLSQQIHFFNLLKLNETLHLSLNESFLISPEKSVTAIAPVF